MPENDPLLPILSDRPADNDRLNFAPYAQTLAEIIADPQTRTPLTIGIFGSWGNGKTSLMQMIENRLHASSTDDFPVRTVWFNAWLYSREETLWRALLGHILKAVREFQPAGRRRKEPGPIGGAVVPAGGRGE